MIKSDPRHILAAGSLIGEPWSTEHNCWWLVREYFERIGGPALPEIAVGEDTPDNVAAIVRVCQAGGLRLIGSGEPQALDIALMRNPQSGRRHVGVLLVADRQVQLLHCEGGVDPEATEREGRLVTRGPGVVAEPLREAMQRYHGLELWRRAA